MSQSSALAFSPRQGSQLRVVRVLPLRLAASHDTGDRNFKGPFYTLRHVRYRLKRDTGVLERGLGSVSDRSNLDRAVDWGSEIQAPQIFWLSFRPLRRSISTQGESTPANTLGNSLSEIRSI